MSVWVLILRTNLCIHIFSNVSELLETHFLLIECSIMRKAYFRKFLYFIDWISPKSVSSKVAFERGFKVIFKNKHTYFLTGKRKLVVSCTKPQRAAVLIITPCSQLLDHMPKQLRQHGPGIIVLEL